MKRLMMWLLDRCSVDQRADFLYAANSKWCMGCGELIRDCMEQATYDCCCGKPKRHVTASQCTECEMINFSTVREA